LKNFAEVLTLLESSLCHYSTEGEDVDTNGDIFQSIDGVTAAVYGEMAINWPSK